MSHNQMTEEEMLSSLDQEYLKDRILCPLCLGHQIIDTDLSIAFGLGLNATPEMKNPYSFRNEHRKFLNFVLGRKTQAQDTLIDMFKRLKA